MPHSSWKRVTQSSPGQDVCCCEAEAGSHSVGSPGEPGVNAKVLLISASDWRNFSRRSKDTKVMEGRKRNGAA